MNNHKLGLVLAGGAAKGAYQVGALKYIAKLGLVPDIIAGTSIGALNGAVLSAYHPFPTAVQSLNEFWDKLAQSNILEFNAHTVIHYAARPFLSGLQKWMLDVLIKERLLPNCKSVLNPAPIEKLLKESVSPYELRRGIELWATVFPSLEIPGFNYSLLMNLVRAKTGTDAHWLCLQDSPDDETLYNILLASAALPIAFPSRKINGQSYVDGFLGDNVPLKALTKLKCTHVIVIHLDNGETLNRHDFPDQTIIEIRPEKPINKSGVPIISSINTGFDFSSGRISDLKICGEEDAERCIIPIIESLRMLRDQRQRGDELVNSTYQLLNDSLL